MRRLAAIGCAAALVTGCAGVKTIRYGLEPAPNSCQVTETRASAFSTLTAVVCWDGAEKVIGMASAGGQPTASIATSLIGAAGTITGAAVIGGAMMEVGRALQASRLVPDRIQMELTAPQLERLEEFARGAAP